MDGERDLEKNTQTQQNTMCSGFLNSDAYCDALCNLIAPQYVTVDADPETARKVAKSASGMRYIRGLTVTTSEYAFPEFFLSDSGSQSNLISKRFWLTIGNMCQYKLEETECNKCSSSEWGKFENFW